MAIIFEKKEKEMACNVTANSGQSKGLEDALGATVKGKLQGKDWKKKKTNSDWKNVAIMIAMVTLLYFDTMLKC